MGRTEFLTPTIRSEPRLESATIYESEMALFSECMPPCARKTLDTADIVRDGDVSLTPTLQWSLSVPWFCIRPIPDLELAVQTDSVNAVGPGTIASVVAGVSVATALLAWMLWRVCKSVE